MAKTWEQMTPAEKRAELDNKFLNPPDIKYVNAEAQKGYKARAQRILDALNMKVPDIVPVIPFVGFFGAFYAGYTPYDVMYD